MTNPNRKEVEAFAKVAAEDQRSENALLGWKLLLQGIRLGALGIIGTRLRLPRNPSNITAVMVLIGRPL